MKKIILAPLFSLHAKSTAAAAARATNVSENNLFCLYSTHEHKMNVKQLTMLNFLFGILVSYKVAVDAFWLYLCSNCSVNEL
jgi:hypothetical protein